MEPFPKFIVVDMYTTQTMIDVILQNYTKLTNLYNFPVPHAFAMTYILGNILARYFNSTLIATDNPNLAHEINSAFPRMMGIVHVFSAGFNPRKIWKQFYVNKAFKMQEHETTEFVVRDSIELNFAYCSVPKDKWNSPWDFFIFTDPFDMPTWFVLSVLLVLVTLIVSYSTGHGILKTFMSTLAALLDNEVTHIVNSKLYVLWLFMTLLIFDFYSGEITSKVTAPPEPEDMTMLSELQDHNYSIIFPYSVAADEIQFTVEQRRRMDCVNRNFEIISKLLPRSRTQSMFVGDGLHKYIARNGQVAAFATWASAMWAATRGSDYIARNKSDKLVTGKTCKIGKHLIPNGEKFVGFTPPGSTQLAKLFRRLQGSGITNRWYQESTEKLHSFRVQDRVKVKGRCSILKEPIPFKPLCMVGKAVSIFLLWVVCLTFCGLALTSELLATLFNRRNTTNNH